MGVYILDEFIVRVYGTRWNRVKQIAEKDKVIRMLYWGDYVEIKTISQNKRKDSSRVDIKIYNYGTGKYEEAYIKKKRKKIKGSYTYLPLKLRSENLLQVLFVDVQQGDASIITLPTGEKILIDGGEGKFVARILAALYPNSSKKDPVKFDSIIVSHGDADHFSGLFEIPESESNSLKRKRVFLKTNNIYHNGLVKSGERTLSKAFGKSVERNKIRYVTDLWDDPRDAVSKSKTFKKWDNVINHILDSNGTIKRLKFGDNEFDRHKRNGIDIQVLGPIVEKVGSKEGLRYYKNEKGSKSASHTVNGHSISIRLSYQNVNLFFGGDLNIDASEHLLHHYGQQPKKISVRSEILKVPHHGSHEFYVPFLKSINPVVSVVSSGDENVSKDYVHPRASLIGALGRASRNDKPLIFCTELAAFFAYMGVAIKPIKVIRPSGKTETLNYSFPAFNRLVYGAVRVRSDGKKILVAVESSSAIKEYYVLTVDSLGNVSFDDKPSII